jgi:CHRD domain
MHSTLSRIAFALCLVTGFGLAAAADVSVVLTGEQEVPPVATAARGAGTLTIAADHSVSGTITTSGITGTMAHIHEGALGKNGPVIIPLEKGTDGKWSVPVGVKLTDAQYKSFEAGELYVNVHSDAHKGGEIRAQLKP